MKFFKVNKPMGLPGGVLMLVADQVARRTHVLEAMELEEYDGEIPVCDEAQDRELVRLVAPTQFKAGEVIGYAGDLDKATAQCLAGVLDGEELADQGEAVDQALLDAMSVLDPDNEDHFTESGVPEVKALKELVERRVTAAERDAAWAAYQAAQAAE